MKDGIYTIAEQKERDALRKKVGSMKREELPDANIIIAGGTGVGKSTLLNAVFGEELAKTGVGCPQTSQIQQYKRKGIPVCIWDTVGLEINPETTQQTINAIKRVIADKTEIKDPFQRIHAIWYCINATTNRYQPAEVEFIRQLHDNDVPFIIVLTQCYSEKHNLDALEDHIRKTNQANGIKDIEIVRVLAQDFSIAGLGTIASFGLNSLVDMTLDKLPDFICNSFIAAQKISKDQKRKVCEKIIWEYIDNAQKRIWDKIPIINIFTANGKISEMFRKMGNMYGADLGEEDVAKMVKTMGSLDLENGFWGVLVPINPKYNQKLKEFFQTKKDQGFDIRLSKLPESERVALILAYTGYTFLDSIEAAWEQYTKEKCEELSMLVKYLKKEFEKRCNKSHKR